MNLQEEFLQSVPAWGEVKNAERSESLWEKNGSCITSGQDFSTKTKMTTTKTTTTKEFKKKWMVVEEVCGM